MKRLLTQSAFYAAGLLLMKGVSFFMLPIIARFLSPAEFGELDIFLTVLNAGSLLVGFGLVDALYKQMGHNQNNASEQTLYATAYWQQARVAGFVALFIAPLIWFSQHWLDTHQRLNLFLTLTTLVISGFINIPLTWLRLKNNAREFFVLTSGKAFAQATLTYAFLQAGYGVTGILLSSLIATTALAVGLGHRQWSQIIQPRNKMTGNDMFRYGTPLVASNLLLFASAGAERLILAGTVGTESLAIYALAMQFAMMVAFLAEPFTLWWYPKRFKILASEQGTQKTAFYAEIACHLTLWITLSIALIAPFFIRHLFQEGYHEAANLVPWLALGMAFKQCSHQLNTGCYLDDKPTIILKLNALTACVALLLFIASSVWFGLLGVVFAFVTIYALRCLVFLVVSQRRLSLPYHYLTLLAHAALVIAMLLTPPFTLGWVVAICLSQAIFMFAVIRLRHRHLQKAQANNLLRKATC